MREQSASVRTEESRSRDPRTYVISDAVGAMPGSSINHVEDFQVVLRRQEDREAHVLSILTQHPQRISTKSSTTTQRRTGTWATALIGSLTPPIGNHITS